MKHLFFLALFLVTGVALAQNTAHQITDENGIVHKRSSVEGFTSEWVIDTPFQGASELDQLIYKIMNGTTENGSNMMWILEHESTPNRIVGCYNREHQVIGSDYEYPGECPWLVLERVLTTDSLRVKEENRSGETWTTPNHLDRYSSMTQMEKLPTGESFMMKFFDLLLIIVCCCVGIYLLYRLIKFLGDLPGILAERARRRAEKSAEAIRKNIEKGVNVDEAGKPEFPNGIHFSSAKDRLEDIAYLPIRYFWPVYVTFLKEVKIGYLGTSVVVKPSEKDTTLYFLGETNTGAYVLCAMRCGNSVLNSDGQLLQIGEDFFVKEVVQTDAVKNYLRIRELAEETKPAEV